jgi:hypothetical protein
MTILVVALDTDKTKNRNGDSTGFLYGTVGDLKKYLTLIRGCRNHMHPIIKAE